MNHHKSIGERIDDLAWQLVELIRSASGDHGEEQLDIVCQATLLACLRIASVRAIEGDQVSPVAAAQFDQEAFNACSPAMQRHMDRIGYKVGPVSPHQRRGEGN